LRIEGIEVEGFGNLSGSFRFSGEGLAVGSTPNEGGKSALGRAVTTALYGPAQSLHPLAADPGADRSWILLHVRMDDGTALSIARDLARGTVQISDGSGIDRTASLLGTENPAPPGERLLGLAREEFERTAILSLDGLSRLDGDTRLARLLGRAKDATAATASAAAPAQPPPFEITRATQADEATLPESDSTSTDADSPAPEQGIVERLRERRSEIDTITASMETKSEELRRQSATQEELRSEVERVGALSGAVPSDIEKLRSLLGLLKAASEKKEQFRREEARFRKEIAERGLTPEHLATLRESFDAIDASDQQFLESYRQIDTVHRGNHALMKSELRFDESRLAGIDAARKRNSKLAVWPFSAAGGLVVASIGMIVLSAPWTLTILVFLPSLGAALYGARCLWHSKKLATGERVQIAATLEKKRAQIAEIEKEQKYTAGRLALLAEKRKLPGVRELTKLYEEWKGARGEIRTSDGFDRRRGELEKEIASIRDKMGSFSIGGGSNTASLDAVDGWESLLRDYVRYFEAQRELDAVSDRVAGIESDLAVLESDRAAVRDSIEETLRACGIDPSKDLDEAIERAALRAWTGEVVEPLGRPEPEFGMPAEEPDLEEAPWQAQVASRAEAIVRRFLPQVRAIEVGPRLDVSLQLDPQGPRLDAAAIERMLSPATRDLVAFGVRMAAAEARSGAAESTPVLLDDPLVRVDDARYDRVLEFLVEDACAKGQVILLTCHEVRTRWFLQQRPALRSRVASIAEPADSSSAAPAWAAFTG
jgi:hypothetical protein